MIGLFSELFIRIGSSGEVEFTQSDIWRFSQCDLLFESKSVEVEQETVNEIST